ncbi:Uncharacterised protein [Collinsella intestinalis]|nr:Uncharacterised protein [Collinsella intestinalis]
MEPESTPATDSRSFGALAFSRPKNSVPISYSCTFAVLCLMLYSTDCSKPGMSERRISVCSATSGFMISTGHPRPSSVMPMRSRSPGAAKEKFMVSLRPQARRI